MITVEIHNDQSHVPLDEQRLCDAVRMILEDQSLRHARISLAVVDDPTIRRRLEELGLEIVPPERRTAEYLANYLPTEIERWAKPIRAAGISAD